MIDSTLSGDVDDDGSADVVQIYALGEQWGIHLVLSHGWETDRELADIADDGPPGVEAVRIVDLGDMAVLLHLGGTLIGPRYGFVVLADCALEPVFRGNGELPELVVGGGLMHSEWFTCEGDRVTQLSVALADDGSGDLQPSALTSWEYRYRPPSVTFVLVAEEESDVALSTLEDLRNQYPPCTES